MTASTGKSERYRIECGPDRVWLIDSASGRCAGTFLHKNFYGETGAVNAAGALRGKLLAMTPALQDRWPEARR